MSRRPCSEGDLVAVPLESGGWAAGLVARVGRQGTLLGYFFGLRWKDPPSAADLASMRPGDAVLVTRFGDLGLIDGSWKVLGPMPGWSRADWPLCPFGREESLTGRFLRVTYEEVDGMPAETEVPEAEFRELPDDGLAGAGFVGKRLDRLSTSTSRDSSGR